MNRSHDRGAAVRLAISTCPNDTFAFHAILQKKIDLLGLDFEIELLDIQQLNDGLFGEKFDVAKASFHAALLTTEKMVVLPSGSALGFGVGPLLLAAEPNRIPGSGESNSPEVTLCPGAHTTAAMLFRLFYGNSSSVEHVVFSDIMPALQEKRADFGVCIHEGRFTWQQEGLCLVEDLGTRWEAETNSPLPLGGILARRDLGESILAKIQHVIRASIEYGLANRDETLETMRQFAQEFDDDVLFRHVDLYVNDWTLDLGVAGAEALQRLSEKAKACDLVSAESRPIEIFAG